jgi:hypothetical protein
MPDQPAPHVPTAPLLLPPTLFFLAGGTGKPVSATTWRARRPQRRMGGLLGLAIHGRRAGTRYDTRSEGGEGEGGGGAEV